MYRLANRFSAVALVVLGSPVAADQMVDTMNTIARTKATLRRVGMDYFFVGALIEARKSKSQPLSAWVTWSRKSLP